MRGNAFLLKDEMKRKFAKYSHANRVSMLSENGSANWSSSLNQTARGLKTINLYGFKSIPKPISSDFLQTMKSAFQSNLGAPCQSRKEKRETGKKKMKKKKKEGRNFQLKFSRRCPSSRVVCLSPFYPELPAQNVKVLLVPCIQDQLHVRT
jgi:hypothetical protein